MQKRFVGLVSFLTLVVVFSSPVVAQVFYPTGAANGFNRPSDAQKKAAEESKARLKYDPHDLSGIWMVGGGRARLMGGTPPPPMTAWGKKQFDEHKPTEPDANPARVVPSLELGNDPLRGVCNPQGYPRSLRNGYVEFFQTPGKILQIFQAPSGLQFGVREIFTDGRILPSALDLDARWYGWAVGHWEGDSLIVESTGYDERAWLNGNGDPHSEEMKLHEVYRHPDATTLEITMTVDDPKAYTKPWVGGKQTLTLALPKGLTIMHESYCVPSEIESYNNGIGDPVERQKEWQNAPSAR